VAINPRVLEVVVRVAATNLALVNSRKYP